MRKRQKELEGAKIAKHDDKTGFALAWFGGHGVHVYDSNGEKVAFWSVGDFTKDNADPKAVERAMEEIIESGNYESYAANDSIAKKAQSNPPYLCVNDVDGEFYDKFFLVWLANFTDPICVGADNEQDALDEAVDYAEEQGWEGFFVDEEEIERDSETEEEMDIIRAGNHGRPLYADEINIRRVPRNQVRFEENL